MKPDLQAHAIMIGKWLLTKGVSVYTSQQLYQAIREANRSFGDTNVKFGLRKTEDALVELSILQRVTLRSDEYRDIERLAVLELHPTVLHLAVSLRSDSYLCHLSAVYLHGLTDQIPRTSYVNKEQSPKQPSSGNLTQAAIDRAFSGSQRKSKYEFRLGKERVVLLSGKNTNRLGVQTDTRTGLDVTDLERTLIDIAVRPRYSGGVFQVSRAYQTAAKEVDIAKLARVLGMMSYKYPYHQSVGFYLSHAGLPESELQPFRLINMEFDFYLDYSIANPVYNESWRVFHPQGV